MAHRRSVLAVFAGAMILAMILATILAMAAGCVEGAPIAAPTSQANATGSVPPPTPTPQPAPSPPPPTTDPATVFAADGIGAYPIGASLTGLSRRSMVAEAVPSELCANVTTAEAAGRYGGQLTLTFEGDTLVAIHTTSPDLGTPSGARVGLTLPELQDIYGARGALLQTDQDARTYLVGVPASTLALAFHIDQGTVASISAGDGDDLQRVAESGRWC